MKDLDQVKLLKKHHLEETNFNYLYDDENNYFFMDPKTFEQIEIKKEIIGEKENYYRKS